MVAESLVMVEPPLVVESSAVEVSSVVVKWSVVVKLLVVADGATLLVEVLVLAGPSVIVVLSDRAVATGSPTRVVLPVYEELVVAFGSIDVSSCSVTVDELIKTATLFGLVSEL